MNSATNYPGTGQGNQIETVRQDVINNGIQHRTRVLTSAAADVAVNLVSDIDVPADKKLLVTDVVAKVNGGTLWGTITDVTIQSTDSTDHFTIPVAALAANAVVGKHTANVVQEDAMALATGGEAGKGLQMVADQTGTGSDLHVTVYYKYIPA